MHACPNSLESPDNTEQNLSQLINYCSHSKMDRNMINSFILNDIATHMLHDLMNRSLSTLNYLASYIS